ncbi:hypothetical protein SAMN02745165_00546 [Malonomonas rubra DSM 5091]|uniref:Secreted protein n=1 Tax=Malonomonas rubra DSM 5091 TaxID=1122189 RepID=A0A1M6CJG4_MALRU|nr:hypothetical protein SAMN02745165_00546 [Malonomonas rubra DSM 5091]
MVVVLLFLSATPLLAQQDGLQEQPSLELLDFLGEFSDGENGWVDPFEVVPENYGALSEPEAEEQEDEK